MGLTDGQKRCIETLGAPLVVAAGAGSGKTFTLTQRIVHALQDGFVDDIDQILAITFTNKAAEELKSRIKSQLRACGLVEQALKVDNAWISTIHKMCSRILRAHAIELGIDPQFQIVEQSQLDAMMQQAVDEVLEMSQHEGDIDIDALFTEYGVRSFNREPSVEKMLKDMVSELQGVRGDVGRIDFPRQRMDVDGSIVRLAAAFENALVSAQQLNDTASRNKWMDKTRDALDELYGLGSNPDVRQAFEIIGHMSAPLNIGTNAFKEEMGGVKALLERTVVDLRLECAMPHVRTLMKLATRVYQNVERAKREAGVLDNDDLLALAAQALEEHPGIAERYRDKFKLVMVDEFQDTDQVQVDMVKRLAGEGFERLCVVGDAQQSIYRFRGADVSVYRRHLAAVKGVNPQGIVELPDNFRSHPDILAYVDRVFGVPSMQSGDFMSLKARRDDPKDDSALRRGERRITIQVTSRPHNGADTELAEQVAFERLAAAFIEYRNAGHPLRHMALLLGRMTNAGKYAQAFRAAGLDCVVSGGAVFANTMEAQMVLELVRVAANPADQLALYNVLAGHAFELDAGDLLLFATGWDESGHARSKRFDRGFASLMSGMEDGNHALSERGTVALGVMDDYLRDVRDKGVVRAIERLMVTSGWLTRLEAQGAQGQASAANVYKALRMLADLSEHEALGPAALAKRFERMLPTTKESPGALSASGGDFIRIMTVHASKGLEFPIVALADMRDGSPSTDPLRLTKAYGKVYATLDLHKSKPEKCIGATKVLAVAESAIDSDAGETELGEIAVRAEDALTRACAQAKADQVGELEEAKRLLYVALTRAREAIIVSETPTWSKSGNPSGMPKGICRSLVEALDGTGEGIVAGCQRYDFGGEQDAVLEVVRLGAAGEELDDASGIVARARGLCEELAHARAVQQAAASSNGEDAAREHALCVPVPFADAPRTVFKLARQNVFSYSSVADLSHEGTMIAALASSYCVGADEPAGSGVLDGGYDAAFSGWSAPALAWDSDFIENDLSFERMPGDADRATDLGSAFHRLAQIAVLHRAENGALEAPMARRIDAMARAGGLGGETRKRLDAALERWFGSDIACQMASCENLAAEVPFFVEIDGEDQRPTCYLEGEIDLLGTDAQALVAHVVDYKTGGSAEETTDQLAEKHVLQAACYAYALMRQGFEEVHATFVRVEHERAGSESEPQCVRYRFDRNSLDDIERVITELARRSIAS